MIGLVGRREGAAESRVLQGRDVRSVRVLGPRLSWHGPELSRRYYSGHGGCAGITYSPFGVINTESAMASSGH